jgi:hypothetical protein
MLIPRLSWSFWRNGFYIIVMTEDIYELIAWLQARVGRGDGNE